MSAQINEIQAMHILAKLRARKGASRAPKLADGTVAIGEGTTTAPAPSATASVASLLTRHVLRDGEIILLILKPSRWFVALNSILFAAGIAIVLCALQLSHAPQMQFHFCVDGGLFLVSCRVMWVVLTWMSRLYVLTDRRILRISGVFNAEIFDCPLRKVARARVNRSLVERLLRLGSIEIEPCDETQSGTAWQTISRPMQVHQQIEAAIRRAKQS